MSLHLLEVQRLPKFLCPLNNLRIVLIPTIPHSIMKISLFLFSVFLSHACLADNASIIEKSLTADAKKENRLVDGGVVVSELEKAGVFTKKPTERQDYSDYYVPQKPVRVLGAQLISFEHQHFQTYMGCCVNPGNAVVLRPSGNTAAIKSFARKNKCKFSSGNQIYLVPKKALKALSEQDRQSLVEVSCKDNYLFE